MSNFGKKPGKFRPGMSSISARDLNTLRDSAKRQFASGNESIISNYGDRVVIDVPEREIPTQEQPMLCTVVAEYDDFLLCTIVGDSEGQYPVPNYPDNEYNEQFGFSQTTERKIYVAKPHILQRAPWDGASVPILAGNPGSEMIVYVNISYPGTSTSLTFPPPVPDHKVGIRSVLMPDTSFYWERITPCYVPGEIITAYVRNTGYVIPNPDLVDPGAPYENLPRMVWQDLNESGRTWQRYPIAYSDDLDIIGSIQLNETGVLWNSDQHNYNVSNSANFINVTGTGQIDWTGIVKPSPEVSRVIWFRNSRDSAVIIKHDNAGSTEGNQFYNTTQVDIAWQPGEVIKVQYDTINDRWTVVQEGQPTVTNAVITWNGVQNFTSTVNFNSANSIVVLGSTGTAGTAPQGRLRIPINTDAGANVSYSGSAGEIVYNYNSDTVSIWDGGDSAFYLIPTNNSVFTWLKTQTIKQGTTQDIALLIDKEQPSSAGQRDSDYIQIRGSSYDTGGHSIDWRYYVDITSNAGASTHIWASRIDGGTFTTRMSLSDAGDLLVGNNLTITNYTQIPEISTPSNPAANNIRIYAKDVAGVTKLVYLRSDGTEVILDDSTGAGSLQWVLVATIDHTDLTDNDTQQEIEVYTLAAKESILAGQLITNTAGSGGSVGSMSMQFKIANDLYGVTGDAFAAGNVDGRILAYTLLGRYVFSATSTTSVKVFFECAGGNLADLTAGEWEVWLLLGDLAS